MLCETAREQLHTLSDGERLPDWRQKAAVLRHCLHCAPCRAYRRQLYQLRQAARSLPASLPAALRTSTLSQLQRASPQDQPQYVNGYFLQKKQKEIAMFKRLTAVTGALLAATVVGTLTARFADRRPGVPPNHWSVSTRRTVDGADQNRLTEAEARDRRQMLDKMLTQLQKQVDTALFANAKRMRTKWKPWAMQHKDLLRELLYFAHHDQHASLLKVYKALPTQLPPNGSEGLTDQDLNAHNLEFTWQIAPKFQSGQEDLPANILNDYAMYSDIRLSFSLQTDTPQYTLWASGRVTQTTQERGIYSKGPQEREILPPYAELTR